MFRVALPQIFENMEEATIGGWLVGEGAEVEVGTPLCELITEKTTLDLTSEFAGTVRQIVAPAKAVIPAGFILALIGTADEEVPDVAAENEAVTAKKAPAGDLEAPTITVPVAPAGATAGSRIRATPAARRAAKDLGISIEEVAAKFPGKVIGEEDVKAF